MICTTTENRIGYIDGLRAVAVLAVVLAHIGKHSSVAAASPLGFFLRQGAHGVDLFFVLSGFCLAYPMLRRRLSGEATFDVFRYAAHRIVRIVPPYWAAIVTLIVFSLAVGKVVDYGSVLPYAIFADLHLQNLNASFWTLPVEFRWYFFFPVALYIWTHSRRAFAALFFAVILSAFTRAWSSDLGTLPAFMLGIVAADAYVSRSRLARLGLIAFVALFVVDAYFSVPEWGDDFGVRWYFAFFGLVAAAGALQPMRKILENPVARFIGVASYSIYLIHEPVIAYLESRHVPMIVSGLAGVAAGVLFWAAVERVFTHGALRDRLVSRVEHALKALLPRAGVPRFMRIGTTTAVIPATTVPERPEAIRVA